MNPPSPFASQPHREGFDSSLPSAGGRFDTLSHLGDTPSKNTGSNSRPAAVLIFQPGAEAVSGYHLVRMIGRGGFGEVWEATGPGGFPLALKFVHLGGSGSHVELRSLEVMKNIRHPHLLGLFGAWKTNDYLIIAMELAEKTLKDRLEEYIPKGLPGIPQHELLEYMREAAKGIDYLNEPIHKTGEGTAQGIQHRDIKPQNLLLVGGSVKVADFGLAKLLEQSVESASGSMSPAYAAPEFCSGQATRWSDQYSLAVTYCQLRGNRLPFTGNLAQLVAGHLSHAPDLSMIPTAREREILTRALLKQPSARWPTCREFVEHLAVALGVSRTSSANVALAELSPLESLDDTAPPPLPRQKQPGVGSRTATHSHTAQMTLPPPLPPMPPDTEERPGGGGMRIALIGLAALLLFGAGIGITFLLLRDNKPSQEVAARQEKEAPADTKKAEEEKKAEETRRKEEEKRRQDTEEKQRFADERKKWELTKQNLEAAAAREKAEREEAERRKKEAEKEAEAERQRRRDQSDSEKQRQLREQRQAEERAADARRDAALKYKAVTRINNRCLTKVSFAIRWRLWDDTWTVWQEEAIEPDQTWIYHRPGAREGQVRYTSNGQERTASLQTVQIDTTADIHKSRSPHHHFWADEAVHRFDVTDEIEELAKLKLRGVAVIDNKTNASSGVIAYRIRWRQADGHSWTKWNDFKVKNGFHYIHSMPGATGLQVEFDHVGGDDKYTPKVYDIEYNLIPAQQEAKASDGRYYYFDYKDQATLDLFKKTN